jgi:hypothetical protein
MSTIVASLSERQLKEHINPFLSETQRGPGCKIALYKIFNDILYCIHIDNISQSALKWMKRQSLSITKGFYFNDDSAFDIRKLARFVSTTGSFQIS